MARNRRRLKHIPPCHSSSGQTVHRTLMLYITKSTTQANLPDSRLESRQLPLSSIICKNSPICPASADSFFFGRRDDVANYGCVYRLVLCTSILQRAQRFYQNNWINDSFEGKINRKLNI